MNRIRLALISMVVGAFMLASEPSARAACPADVSGDGVVNEFDILAIIGAWGPNPADRADTNCDNIVNVPDLLYVISNMGSVCSPGSWRELIAHFLSHSEVNQCIIDGQASNRGTVTSISQAVEEMVDGAAFVDYNRGCQVHRIADIADPDFQAQVHAIYAAYVQQYIHVGDQLVLLTWTLAGGGQFTTLGVDPGRGKVKFEPLIDVVLDMEQRCATFIDEKAAGGASQGTDTRDFVNGFGRLKATLGIRVRAASTSNDRCNSTAVPLFDGLFICSAAFPWSCSANNVNVPPTLYCKSKPNCTCRINTSQPQPGKMDCADASYTWQINLIATAWFGGASFQSGTVMAWCCADGTGGSGNPGP